jgi:hypothetical protein
MAIPDTDGSAGVAALTFNEMAMAPARRRLPTRAS